MLRLTSNITIGNYGFKNIVSVECASSWDTFTDTATIVIPRKVEWQGKYLYEHIKKGDKVVIELGYNDQNKEIFQGYVTSVSARIPVEIKVEDAAWLLKQNTITKSYKKVELSQLLKDILPSVVLFEAPGVSLGSFRISNATTIKILEELKSAYFLKSFFRGGKLYVGFAYVPKLQKKHVLKFNQNVVSVDDLNYKIEDDVKIKLKIVNILPNNKKQEYEFGDTTGEQRTLTYYDKKEADIKKIGAEEIKRLRYTGYRGSITIFGEPMINHGDAVKLIDPKYPEREGTYLVKSVNKSFGDSGYRQTIELDIKINES